MNKRRKIIIFGLLGIFLLSSSGTADFEEDLFWSKIDTTVVLTNSTDSLNIGENRTTEFKTNINGSFHVVNGTSTFDNQVKINDDFYLDGGYIMQDILNDFIITNGVGQTILQIPVAGIIINTIAFPVGTYDVVSTTTTQTINGQKNFFNPITYFANKLVHSNDPDTYIEFIPDSISFTSGNKQMITLKEAGVDQVVINPTQTGIEFVVSTETQTEAFKVTEEPNIECNLDVSMYDDTFLHGDTYFISDGAGFPYGTFWIHENNINVDITGFGVNNYVNITGWSEGLNNLVVNNSYYFEVNKIGVYDVVWDISGTSAGANKIYEVDIFVANIEQDSGSARQEFPTANSFRTMSGHGRVDVTSTRNLINIRMKQVGGIASDFNILNANFNIIQIGGT